MFKGRGGGVKGVLSNVKKTARLAKRGIPYLKALNGVAQNVSSSALKVFFTPHLGYLSEYSTDAQAKHKVKM